MLEPRAVVLHEELCEHFREGVRRDREFSCLVVGSSAAPQQLPAEWNPRRLTGAAEATYPEPCDEHPARRPVLILGTSGTTGRSKAVIINSACAAGWAELMVDQFRFAADDVLYCPFPLHHIDGTILTVVAALVAGGVAAIGERFSPHRFWEEVRQFEATVFNYVGASLVMLAERPPSPDDRNHRVRLAWGVQRHGLTQRFAERFGVPLVEGYGSTEIGCPLWNDPDGPVQEGSCGRPRQEYEVEIVDSLDRPVGLNIPGEIVIRPRLPELLADGYLGMPAATLDTRRNLWLHTGDLAFRDSEGNYYFVGRTKDMIRRRAENIAAYEIEETIAAHPDIAEIAAIGVPSELSDEDIAVFVVVREGASLDPGEVVRFAADRMGRHMVPRYVIMAETLPRTPTEKCDKQALKATFRRDVAWDRSVQADAATQPR
jgi:crotonobetaine/carnitine-CoA ligase